MASSRKRSVTAASPTKPNTSQLAENKELIRGISQKEVEIDHLRTALHAVSLRLEVFKDTERDVYNS